MGERRAPCVQHGGDADPRAEAPGVGGDGERRLGRRLHQEVVDHALVLIGDVAQLARQRVDDVKVWDGQQLRFAVGQPSPRRRSLALRTMPVAAGVVGDAFVRAFSQRSTWPPSAAVRQRSIALITFSWSRLAWPRLASRHAGPCSRRMSATSRTGRTMTDGAIAPAASRRVASPACGAAGSGARAGSRSWR